MTTRLFSTSLAVGWLFLLLGLADVVVGVYRCHDVDRGLTDLLAAALPRSQICLLAIWLVAGSERLSIRLCGLVAGSCFLFMVFSRFLFPGQYDIGPQAHWLEPEWVYYFRLSGPGDMLVKFPLLLFGVALPLWLWRMGRVFGRRHAAHRWQPLRAWRLQFQFRFQDAALWTITLCLVLAAIYRTPPYAAWLSQVFGRWREIYRFHDAVAVYAVASGWLYVLIALVSLWAIHSRAPLWLRIPLAASLVIGAAWGCELWLRSVMARTAAGDYPAFWFAASGETLVACVAAAMMIGSLSLMRLVPTGPPAPAWQPGSRSLA